MFIEKIRLKFIADRFPQMWVTAVLDSGRLNHVADRTSQRWPTNNKNFCCWKQHISTDVSLFSSANSSIRWALCTLFINHSFQGFVVGKFMTFDESKICLVCWFSPVTCFHESAAVIGWLWQWDVRRVMIGWDLFSWTRIITFKWITNLPYSKFL